MAALTDLQRKFIYAMYQSPQQTPTEWARTAGYSDNGGSMIRVQAHKLWHDERIQAAILEEGQRLCRGVAPLALRTVMEIMTNPQELGSTRLRASEFFAVRGGVHTVTEQKVSHEIVLNDEQKIERLRVLEAKLGLDPGRLVGRTLALRKPAIEAEYEEVPNTSGIEDLL